MRKYSHHGPHLTQILRGFCWSVDPSDAFIITSVYAYIYIYIYIYPLHYNGISEIYIVRLLSSTCYTCCTRQFTMNTNGSLCGDWKAAWWPVQISNKATSHVWCGKGREGRGWQGGKVYNVLSVKSGVAGTVRRSMWVLLKSSSRRRGLIHRIASSAVGYIGLYWGLGSPRFHGSLLIAYLLSHCLIPSSTILTFTGRQYTERASFKSVIALNIPDYVAYIFIYLFINTCRLTKRLDHRAIRL